MELLYGKIAEYTQDPDRQEISRNTAVSYYRDLKKMAEYFTKQGITDYHLITEADLRAYMLFMEDEKKRPATIARSLAAIKAFFRYLVQQGELTQNPALQLKAPKVEKTVPHVLTTEEVVRLLRQPEETSEKAVRDWAMLELLYATGIRVSELLQLKLSDVSLQMEYILCSQGGRERVIPFGKTAKQALEIYLETARPMLVADSGCDLLFTNRLGQRMSRQGFWKIIRQYGKDAGISGEITPHTLRHSFAAHLVGNGADLFAVQEMMGYSDLSAAQVYARMHHASIRETYTKAHPRE